MTRRTKLWICAGVLVLVVGAAMVSRPAKPAVEARFVRYDSNGKPVLSFTNKGQQPVCFPAVEVWLCSDMNRASFRASPTGGFMPSVLLPGSGTQLVVWPAGTSRLLWSATQGTAFVQYAAQPSIVRRSIENLLGQVGIDIVNSIAKTDTGFVATVTLPPREKAASPSPP